MEVEPKATRDFHHHSMPQPKTPFCDAKSEDDEKKRGLEHLRRLQRRWVWKMAADVLKRVAAHTFLGETRSPSGVTRGMGTWGAVAAATVADVGVGRRQSTGDGDRVEVADRGEGEMSWIDEWWVGWSKRWLTRCANNRMRREVDRLKGFKMIGKCDGDVDMWWSWKKLGINMDTCMEIVGWSWKWWIW